MPGQFATLVWSTTPEKAAALKTLGPAEFTAMVNAAFALNHVDLEFMTSHLDGSGDSIADEVAWRINQTDFNPTKIPPPAVAVQDKSVASFPLRMRHADTYISERVALIGYPPQLPSKLLR